MDAEVRAATAPDIAGIVRVHARSFRARGLSGAELLAQLESPEQAGRWPRRIRSVVVAGEGDDDVIGFAWWGPAITGDWRNPGALVPGRGELYLIAVEPDRWRHGIGRRLLDTAGARLAQADYDDAVLWTDERNEPAQRLYRACGWEPDGDTRSDLIDGVMTTSLRYHRRLDV